MFGGQSLSILLVKVSIPGAPFELHEDKANIISLRVMSGSLGIFWSVESGGSGSISMGVGWPFIVLRYVAK